MSESDAYTLGYNQAVLCARPLKGLVKYIECGNELDTTGLKIGGNGRYPSDWSPAGWGAFRGVIRGMIDGVKAVDPNIKCGVNVGIPLGYGALQMLWNGVQPNGTALGQSGATALQWDFTTYHWYRSSGNIVNACNRGECSDVLAALRDSFKKPIWLTEWGWSGANDSPETAAAYVQTTIDQYHSLKSKYDIQTIMLYALIDDSFGLIKNDGVSKMPAYATMKNYIAKNQVLRPA